MTKEKALKHAAAAHRAADDAAEKFALRAAVFGGNDDLAKTYLEDADACRDAAREWDRIAGLHHATRNALIRSRTLPSWMFGFDVKL